MMPAMTGIWSRAARSFCGIGLFALFAACLAPTSVNGQARWQPTEPVDFIIMAGPGGGADKATRLIAGIVAERKLAPVELQPRNVAGNDGADALAALQQRTGNAHTLLFTLNSFYTVPLDQPELQIDIGRLGPVARMGEDAFLLWVNAKQTEIRSLEDFILAAKSKGKGWVMAGTGTGSEDNLLTDFLNANFGLDMTYKSFAGGGEVGRELAHGRADSTVNNPSEQNEFYPKGLTKPLLTFSPRRLASYPAAPALRETGVEFHYVMQRSVVAPGGLAAGVMDYYIDLMRRVFDTPEWQAYRKQSALSGDFMSGEPLRRYWLGEREKHRRWKSAISALR